MRNCSRNPQSYHRGDLQDATQLICDRIPQLLCKHHGITPPPSAWRVDGATGNRLDALKFCEAQALNRAYSMAGRGGLPDAARVYRMILRDYCTGRTPFYEAPPNFLMPREVTKLPVQPCENDAEELELLKELKECPDKKDTVITKRKMRHMKKHRNAPNSLHL